jgi:ABC-2 type transport system permease protein
MSSLFWKEINAFFTNLTGYMIMVVFLVSLGLIVWVFPGTSVLEYGFSDLEALFSYTPLVFMFLIPAITMRMIADEKKSGTWELLLTSPLPVFQIMLAKYLATLVLIVLTLLPTLVYYYSIVQLGDPVGNIDSAGFFGSFIGLLLMGAAMASIGMFSSSLTDSQIVAFVIGVFTCFMVYIGFSAMAALSVQWGYILENISLSYHYESMSRGVIFAENVCYFAAFIACVLTITWGIISKK